MKRTILIFLTLTSVIFFYCSCNGKESKKGSKTGEFRTETIDGVLNIFNPAFPQKGVVMLQLEKILEIDSSNVIPNKTVFFHIASKSDYGDIFIGDINKIGIYTFNKNGELKNRFLNAGEGPGEIPFGPFSIQPDGTNVWVAWRMKIIKFNKEAKVIDEFKLEKKYENIEIIDENRFIGNFFKYDDKISDASKGRKCVCALLNKEEQVLIPFMEDSNAGFTEIKKKVNGEVLNINFSISGITPKIIHRLDANRENLYICVSSDYTIYKKNLKGKTIKIIHMAHQNAKLTDNDRSILSDELFIKDPPDLKKIKQENLPGNLCAIKDFQLLQSGCLAVSRIKSLLETEIDIISPYGDYLYKLKLPFENPVSVVYFKGNILGILQTIDDRAVFREYKIKNLPEIFRE